MVLSIADDGVGLDATVRGGGQGLRSMQERAKRIGADLQYA